MRKKVFGRHLSRGRKSREALFRALIKAMILRGSMVTTYAKVKAIEGMVNKLVTTAKVNSLSARRRVLASLGNDKESVSILFDKVAPAFSAVKSGFTKVTLLPTRVGDNAQMARIEWTKKIETSVMKEQVTNKKGEKEPTTKKSEKIDNKK